MTQNKPPVRIVDFMVVVHGPGESICAYRVIVDTEVEGSKMPRSRIISAAFRAGQPQKTWLCGMSVWRELGNPTYGALFY